MEGRKGNRKGKSERAHSWQLWASLLGVLMVSFIIYTCFVVTVMKLSLIWALNIFLNTIIVLIDWHLIIVPISGAQSETQICGHGKYAMIRWKWCTHQFGHTTHTHIHANPTFPENILITSLNLHHATCDKALAGWLPTVSMSLQWHFCWLITVRL